MISGKNAVNRSFLFFFASLFFFPLILAPTLPSSAQATPSISGAAPNFELPDLNGSTVELSKFKGQKPVLLYFWATWCPHCVAVRPEVIKLRNGIAQNDLALLAINVGGMDSLAKVKRFEEANPAPFTVLYDSEGKSARLFKVLGIPHFILIDKNGTIKYSGIDMPLNPMALLKQ